MRNAFVFIIMLAIGISCKNKEQDESGIMLSFKYQKEKKVSEFISNVEYIRLEANDSCKIGAIKQMLIHNNCYYILDASVGKSVYVFDENGKYLNKINQVGQGPGEYAMPYCIAVNKYKNELIIRDVMQNKMIIYDAKTLSYIREDEPNIEAQYFCTLNNYEIIWYNTSEIIYENDSYPYHILITNSLYNSSIEKMIPVEFSTGYILRPSSPFYQTDSYILCPHPYNGKVYEISENQKGELLTLEFEKHYFPEIDYLKNNESKANFVPSIHASDYINYLDIFESQNHYCFNVFAANTYFLALYDKTSNQGEYFPVSVVENNSLNNAIIDDLGILYFNNPIVCIDDGYYSIIQPYKILEKYNEYDGEVNSQLQEIIETIKEDDNSIILKYKLNIN